MSKSVKRIILSIFVFLISLQSCKSEENRDGGNKVYSESQLAMSISEQAESVRKMNDEISSSRQNAITRTVASCSAAVVGINVTEVVEVEYKSPFDGFMDHPFFNQFFQEFGGGRRTREYQVQGLGSGFIISPDGYILTNHHVAGNASKILVTLTNGDKVDAEIIGTDPVSDIALLKISGNNYPYLKFANSESVLIGEWVIAFGNPFGLFSNNAKPTVTVGVISNVGVNFVHTERNLRRVYRDLLQTDAAISSGNSGGPLVNSLGEVIGMNTMIFSTAQNQQGAGSIGIGFAVPVNRIKTIVEMLKNNKKIDRNYFIGMDVREIDDKLASYLKISQKEGLIVFSTQRNSPAEEAGIEPGDIIQEVDGYKVLRAIDYNTIIYDGITGQKLNFVILRDGKKLNKTLTLKPLRR